MDRAYSGQGNWTDWGSSAEPSNLRSWTKIPMAEALLFVTWTRNWMFRWSESLGSKL